ncbi:MAG TPA: CRISPR-associated helicase Cas3' [Phycisphaerae bacterium]|nr:CRISPR-associated helicase Cas3' [Phycisphaerae bacterium]
MKAYYAHSLEGRPSEEWERVETHLNLVADGDASFPGASGFAGAFGASDWGHLLGLWHDLGKYSQEFQDYILGTNGFDASLESLPNKVDHATAGGQHAVNTLGAEIGQLLAYCICGHHGGLADHVDRGGGQAGLQNRLGKEIPSYSNAPRAILEQASPKLPSLQFGSSKNEIAFHLSIFCRMLFSCLVDADFLATESFMSPDRVRVRPSGCPTPPQLEKVLDAYLDNLLKKAKPTEVNQQRRSVLDGCRKAAERSPGFFSLTVPTGGGKTLSSMAFALKHAAQHELRRVIYAIPFTSIIEQNAKVFRDALKNAGEEVVLEHHCNLDPEQETVTGRLAAENWDAPVVVTTNVQFFESLFANKPSRCRKLHRIARSVIILDEAQTLPVDLLKPTLAMLAELVRNYGCSIVLCSATQPAVKDRTDFPIGLSDVHEIVTDVPKLFKALERVELNRLGKLDDDALVERLLDESNRRSLCVVNTRGHAAKLFSMLQEQSVDPVFHLSAQMCPAHRSDVLSTIRERLKDPQSSCRVISTQLVEAGVDLDFPVVFRAIAGLDSILQAAGRCNREGRLQRGHVFVFETEGGSFLEVRQAANETREVARAHPDLTSLAAIEDFFRLHYWQRKDRWDEHEIMKATSLSEDGLHAQFREVADSYKLIRNEQASIIVPYGAKGKVLIEQMRAMGSARETTPEWKLRRQLQQYTVSIHQQQLEQLIENTVLEPLHERYWVICNKNAYDDCVGLRVVGPAPEDLIT